MSKLYPIGIQNFESLRKDGYYYVDKTEIIYNLVKTGRYYFLSRPRRFGKSLLISTLEAYFQGKKELFTGLAMEKLEKDWIAYPILHLDLNTENYSIPQNLELKLERALSAWEQLYGSDPAEKSLASRFEGIIQRAYEKTGQRVVILVDEYDKPMLQAIGNEALQTSYRNTLKGFYGALKSKDGCIRFGILTGVTKFSKVSVFSDLNNLDDISMWNEYIEICGISDRELEINFKDDLHKLADATDGILHESGISHKRRTHRPRIANRPVHLHYGIQAERHCGRGSATNQRKTLCSPVRSRFSKVTSDRGKLLQQNKKHREVAGGRLRLTY